MLYCLDTNTCIAALRGTVRSLAERFAEVSPEEIAIPALVKAELLFGALRSRDPNRTRRVVIQFLAPFQVLPFDDHATPHYADIRQCLEGRGTPLGPNDLVIAATTRSRGLTLITHNVREFGRVPGLRSLDWEAHD